VHHAIVCLICVAVIVLSVTANWTGIDLHQPAVLALLVLGVAVIGVPHGGLDHWVGRQRLQPTLGRLWAPVFLIGYLAIAILVAVGWTTFPLSTAIVFFLISAWHFGWEDDRLEWIDQRFQWVTSVAIGGLLIWVPAIARPLEMQNLLTQILPSKFATTADEIMTYVFPVSVIACAIALVVLLIGFWKASNRGFAFRNSLFVGLFALAPIPISFGVYFVGWHSVRGLVRLHRDSGCSFGRWLEHVAPLSLLAVLLVFAGGVWWGEGRAISDEVIRSLFIGLSAIAVPHLLLHAWVPSLRFSADSVQAMPAKGVVS